MEGNCRQENLNRSENSSLDLEFRQILCVIKRFIPYVNSNAHLSLYRAWLEKLNSTHCDKLERNKYLLELARQIKTNSLFPPFNQRPPLGPLCSFPEVDSYPPPAWEPPRSNNPVWSGHSQPISSNKQDLPHQINHPEYQTRYQLEASQTLPNNNFPNSEDQFVYYHPYYTQENEQETVKGQEIPELEDNMYIHNFANNRPLNVSHCFAKVQDAVKDSAEKEALHKCQEDSSWCDLTDASATSLSLSRMGSGDSEKPALQNDSENYINAPIKIDNNFTISTDQPSEMVDFKLPEPLEARFPLKDTNYLSADWKKTIEALQMRLTETLSQNIELKSTIDNLKGSIKYETTHKEQLEMKRKRSSELHQQEIERLKTTHDEDVRQLEGTFDARLRDVEDEYELKFEEIKAEYEMRMREQKLEEERDKKEKDKEICRLSEIIQQQCTRMSNEIVALRQQIEASLSGVVPEEKVYVLQKCVSKMDKLFHKAEKEYMKRIEKLKQELELRDKVTQIHLKTQRAELIARSSAEKQKQLDEVVSNLEVKYIKMLERYDKLALEDDKTGITKGVLQENCVVCDAV